MDSVMIELLVGLFFMGSSLPGLFSQPIDRGTLIQFVFGLVLFILAFLHISLVR